MKNGEKFKEIFGFGADGSRVIAVNATWWDCEFQNRKSVTKKEKGGNMSEWTSVKDKLPEEPGRYLVSGKFFDSQFQIWICDFIGIGAIRGWSNPCRNPTVSFWMPLPEPPEEET